MTMMIESPRQDASRHSAATTSTATRPVVGLSVAAPAARVRLAWQRRVSAQLVGADLVAASAGLVASVVVMAVMGTPVRSPLGLVFPAIWVAAIAGCGGYSTDVILDGRRTLGRLLLAWLVTGSSLGVVGWSSDLITMVPRFTMTITLTVALVVSGIARAVVHRTIQRRRACGEYTHRVVLFGNDRETRELDEKMRESAGFDVVGICDMVDRPGALPDSDITRLTSMVRDRQASMVMVGGAGHDLRRLSWALEPTGAEVMFTTGLRDVDTARLKVAPGGDIVTMALGQPKFTGVGRVLKTMVDRTAAAAAVAVLAPLFAVIALAIKLDSPGPVIFKQTRVGEHGRPFQIFKFRSMTVDAEARKKDLGDLDEGSGALFKVREDPRITRVGGFLRRTSLDELPQLLNVLLGQMSLVGPRPHLQEEMLSSSDPTWTRRLLVKPGVTGLWQVSGRSDLSHEDTVRLDLSYVENWSLLWDLAIMLRTPLSMARRQGAY